MSAVSEKKRGRGRPRANGDSGDGLVNRRMIVDLAYDLARSQPIDDVSFVQMARQLGVKPGALHYHVGTKDDLASAILNRFYKDLLARLGGIPSDIGWRERIAQFARILMGCERGHVGAAEHIQRHAKFRVFQRVRDDETDYGARYLDQTFSMLRDMGFDAETAAMFYHVLALHCLAAANSANTRLEPSAHENFLTDKANAYRPGEMPGLEFGLRAFARIRADEAFELGLGALLDHFEHLRGSQP